METVNNRLMGMALIDKAWPSEARGCVGMEDESVKSVHHEQEIPGLHPTMSSSDGGMRLCL